MSESIVRDFGNMFGFLVPAIDKDVRDRKGRTPLHLAAAKGHLSAVQWLLGQGANPRAKDDADQCTPLHIALLRLQKEKEEGKNETDGEIHEERWEWKAENEWTDDSSYYHSRRWKASFDKLRLGLDAIKGLKDVIRVLKGFAEGADIRWSTDEEDVEERDDEGWETENEDAEDSEEGA
jgi:hypothetical protein